jgi:hypothetical protein
MSYVFSSVRRELHAVAQRRADRADRMLAELGACDAVVAVYKSVADAFAAVGDARLEGIYRVRTMRTAEFLESPRRCPGRPTVPVMQRTLKCPDRSDCPVTQRAGYLAPSWLVATMRRR